MRADLVAEMNARAREKCSACWQSSIRRRKKRLPSEWAREERWLAAGGPLAKGEDIQWNQSVMPHTRQPMDDADDPSVNVIVLWMGRRMGKTEGISMNIIGRAVTDAPENIISMWPVEDSRDRFSRDVVETTIAASPALRTKFVEAKSRDAGRTIGYKRFHGGSLIINYSGSKSQTKGMAAGVVIAHEIDAYPASSQGEGDPIEKLLGRAEGFEAIKILESTGTLAATFEGGKKVYHSNIEKWYDRSDQRKWFCPCRACGHGQWLKFEQIREIEKKSGEVFFYLCEKCDADHADKQWRRMVGGGQWKPTEAFVNGVRGYWINGFNSLLPAGKGFSSKLHQFHAEGHRALKASPEERRVWINEVKTELVSNEDESQAPPPYQPILDGREDYATKIDGVEKIVVPERALVLTAMTDLHGNRLEIEWRAWAPSEESWGLGLYVLHGDTNRSEVWDQWTKHLQKTFPHASGAHMALSMAFVDGGWRSDPIASTLRRLRETNVPGVSGKVRVSKGTKDHAAVISNRWGTVNKGKGGLKGVHIGTWCAKSLIYDRLRWHSATEKPEVGFMHFGQLYEDEFIRQAVSERPGFEVVDGKTVESFKNPDGNRNEGLDLLVGNLAAFRYLKNGLDFEAIRRELAEDAERRKRGPVAPAAKTGQVPPTSQGRGGFSTGWRV